MQAAVSRGQAAIGVIISLLSLAGVAVSGLALHHHYGRSPSSFCSFGANFNCDMVNRSIYSAFLGIPVALIGIIGYLVILVLANLSRNMKRAPAMLLAASVGGLGFALYLTYIEAFVLAVWCVLCLSSLGIMLTITLLALARLIWSPWPLENSSQ